MRFWDSSGVVPLVVNEPTSSRVRELLRDDPVMLVWVLTPLEVCSALWRRHRMGDLDESGLSAARQALAELEQSWSVATDVDRALRRARRVVATHPLRAGDALQLASALMVCDEESTRLPFVTLDAQLARCARGEGFPVLPAPSRA